MTRTYLRYDSAHAGGVLLSQHCNAIFAAHIDATLPAIAQKTSPDVFITAAARRIQFIDVETGALLHSFPIAPEGDLRDSGSITTFLPSADTKTIFIGMSTGRVSIFQYEVEEGDFIEQASALAHRGNTKISVLASNAHLGSNSERLLLASGGQDTAIVIWDVFGKEAIARLEGHRGPIVGLHFIEMAQRPTADFLLSVAEDGMLKLWDVANAYCVHTIVVSETASFLTASHYSAELGALLIAAKDSYLRAYAVNGDFVPQDEVSENLESSEKTSSNDKLLLPLQDIARRESRVIQSIAEVHWADSADKKTTAFLCATKDRLVEVYSRVDNVKKRKKAQKRAAAAEGPQPSGISYTGALYATASKIAAMIPVHRQQRLRTPIIDVAIGLRNNSIERIANLPTHLVTAKPDAKSKKAHNFLLESGHAGEVTAVALNSTATALVTLSPADGVRRWNFHIDNGSLQIVSNGSVPCPSTTAMVLLPDDQTVLCGSPAGEILRVSLRGMEISQRVLMSKELGGKAKVTAMCLGSISKIDAKIDCVLYACGADTVLRTFALTSPFELPEAPARTLDLPDVATCAACCPENRLLAVGLQDTSIRLYFIDSFKQYLKLYGHAYPALSLSITSDATMLCSGGMDKSLKIWGLDFGDLHRSIKAHDEYVTGVQCIPNTHYVATSSNDGTVKLWDGDHWDLIQELHRGAEAPVSALCVAPDGASVISADKDGFIKAFERTNETLFLQEEIEKRMELAVDRELDERAVFEAKKKLAGEVTSRTVSAVAASDSLRERIDRMLHDKLHAAVDESEDTARHRHLRLWRFLSQELRAIDMYHALTGLSFDVSRTVLDYLNELLEKGLADDIERCAHIVSILGRLHYKNLPHGLLGGLASKLRARIEDEKRSVGLNLAGLKFVQKGMEKLERVEG